MEGLVLEFGPAAVQGKHCSWVCVSKVNAAASRGRFHPLLLLLARMGKGRDTEYHKGLYRGRKDPGLGELDF